MRFYGLSEQRVRRVINSPKRVEEGIAPKTVAMMQPVSPKFKYSSETVLSGAKRSRRTSLELAQTGKREETWNQEIWVMLQNETKRKDGLKHNVITIISAWRYPGRTKPGQPIPAEILKEVRGFL